MGLVYTNNFKKLDLIKIECKVIVGSHIMSYNFIRHNHVFSPWPVYLNAQVQYYVRQAYIYIHGRRVAWLRIILSQCVPYKQQLYLICQVKVACVVKVLDLGEHDGHAHLNTPTHRSLCPVLIAQRILPFIPLRREGVKIWRKWW